MLNFVPHCPRKVLSVVSITSIFPVMKLLFFSTTPLLFQRIFCNWCLFKMFLCRFDLEMKPAQVGLVSHFLIYQFIYLSRIFNQAGPVQLRAVLNLDLLHLSHSFSFFFSVHFFVIHFSNKVWKCWSGWKKKTSKCKPFSLTKQLDRRPSAEKGNNIPFKLVEAWEECSGKVR